jgi:transposase
MKTLPQYKNNLRNLCADRDWTAEQLRFELQKEGEKVSTFTIYKWYRQERQPGRDKVVALCKIFGVETGDIFKF